MKILLFLWILFSPLAGFSDEQISRMFEPEQAVAETDGTHSKDASGDNARYLENVARVFAQNPAIARFVLEYSVYHGADVRIDLTKEVKKGEIPLFLQWDPRWGYQTYGSGYLARTGCGPTCLSMVYCGLTGDTAWNPYRMARMSFDSGYYVWGAGTAWGLMTEGARSLGLTAREISIDADAITDALRSGEAVICSMRPGDFTKKGHFIVLSGIEENGKIRVCDPNSEKNSKTLWEIERILPQIKGSWAYRYDGS